MSFIPFTFAQISDSHVRANGAEWKLRVEQVWAAIQALKPTPEFVLHSGDLVDDPSEDAVSAFKAQFSGSKVPLYVIPGNHDVWNAPVTGEGAPWWTRTTTSGDEQRFRTWFGPTAFSFIAHDCGFVGFNSQLLNASFPEAEAQAKWLVTELARLKGLGLCHLILFTHMPLFVRSPDEELDWTDWRNSYLVTAPPSRNRLLALIQQFGVSAYLSGHLHYPLEHMEHWSEKDATRFVVCDASGPISSMAQEQFQLPPTERFGYCLHHVKREGIETEFVMV